MNNNKAAFGGLALAAALASGLGAAAYGGAHAAAGSRPAPVLRVAQPRPATTGTGVSAAALTGAWVYKDALTVETLRLKAGKGGIIGGSGDSTVKSTKDPHVTGQYTIGVHDGRLRNNVLTLTLYVQQQSGTYFTLVENLRCTPTARVLRCTTSAQIAYKVTSMRQDFYRR